MLLNAAEIGVATKKHIDESNVRNRLLVGEIINSTIRVLMKLGK